MARRVDPGRLDSTSGAGALRTLVGAGPSQVGVVGALRARDVSRPTQRHLRDALAKPEPVARPAPRQDASEVPRQDASDAGIAGGTPVVS